MNVRAYLILSVNWFRSSTVENCLVGIRVNSHESRRHHDDVPNQFAGGNLLGHQLAGTTAWGQNLFLLVKAHQDSDSNLQAGPFRRAVTSLPG